jgi:hypothetical protein
VVEPLDHYDVTTLYAFHERTVMSELLYATVGLRVARGRGFLRAATPQRAEMKGMTRRLGNAQ